MGPFGDAINRHIVAIDRVRTGDWDAFRLSALNDVGTNFDANLIDEARPPLFAR